MANFDGEEFGVKREVFSIAPELRLGAFFFDGINLNLVR